MFRPPAIATRFLRDDRGQDLLEYGLLAATIAIAGVVVFPDIATRMGVLFDRWAGDINNAWVPPAPLP